MGRKRKESAGDYPEDWDIVEESQDPDAPFETVADTPASGDDEEELSEDLLQLTVVPAVKRKSPKKATAKSKQAQVGTERPTRQKSVGTIREKAFRKDKGYCNVVCWLESICRDPRLCKEIRRTALAMKQIQLEAWHLVNLHALRCLENGLDLPDFTDKTLFDHCCAGVATTNKSHFIAQKNPALWQSILLYQSHRQRAGLAEVDHEVGNGELKCDLREQMVVNAGVMIREHFRKRLRLYIQLTFGQVKDGMTKKQRKEKAELANAIVRACYTTDGTEIAEAQQMRDLLTPVGVEWSERWVPWPNHIKANGLAFYVRLLWKFQGEVEKRMEESPNEKGVRAFTLFTVSTKYSKAHITLNGTTLAGLYARIPDHEFGLPHIPVTAAAFKASRWEVMRHAFDVARFETRETSCPLSKNEFAQLSVEEKYEHASHLFANQVTTDGYGASVLLFRPKTEEETLSKKKKKRLDGPVVPAGYAADVVVGLDPGMRSVCTAVREVLHHRDTRRRKIRRRRRRRSRGQRKRKKSNRLRWIRRPKPAKRRSHRGIVQVTTREYRHLAGFNRFRAWNEGQKKQSPQYQKVLADMPSFKTASFSKYLERLGYFWQHARFLLQFCADRPLLKWKFFQKRMARVAVDAVAKRIVPVASKRTCVAFGDWSRCSGIKGHASSPVKGLKQALQKRATVVSMDEFRTSKLCSQCHQTLSPVRYTVDTQLPKRRKRKGVVLPRDRAEAHWEEKKCHGVLRCDHKDCAALYWDRDVNAAINMLELLKAELLGHGRMGPFRR